MVGLFLAFDLVFTPFGTLQGCFHMHLLVGVIHFSVPVIILLVPSEFFSIQPWYDIVNRMVAIRKLTCWTICN